MIKKISLGSAILSAFILFFCFFAYHAAKAQEMGIKITPVILEELVEPGQVLRRQIKVTNDSSQPRTFYAYLRDFGAEGETGQAKLLAPGTDYGFSIASWIGISGGAIQIGANEEKVIDYDIKVPDNAGPGGYRGAILFGSEPPRLDVNSEDKGAGMSIAQQAASLVMLRVKGDVKEEANIKEFNTDKDYYGTPFDVNFLVRIENTGNVHVKPRGTITIKNMFGKETAVIRVNEAGGNILPASVRRFMDIKWNGKNGFGKYTATLGLSYGTEISAGGQGKSSMVGTKTFWIIPWRIIGPIGIAVIFLSGLLFFMLRMYKNRAVKQAMERAGVGHLRSVKKYKGAPSPALHMGMIITASFIVILLIFVMIYIFFIA